MTASLEPQPDSQSDFESFTRTALIEIQKTLSDLKASHDGLVKRIDNMEGKLKEIDTEAVETKKDFACLKSSMDFQDTMVEDSTGKLTDLQRRNEELEDEVCGAKQCIDELFEKTNTLERFSRRNNLRIIGM